MRSVSCSISLACRSRSIGATPEFSFKVPCCRLNRILKWSSGPGCGSSGTAYSLTVSATSSVHANFHTLSNRGRFRRLVRARQRSQLALADCCPRWLRYAAITREIPTGTCDRNSIARLWMLSNTRLICADDSRCRGYAPAKVSLNIERLRKTPLRQHLKQDGHLVDTNEVFAFAKYHAVV